MSSVVVAWGILGQDVTAILIERDRQQEDTDGAAELGEHYSGLTGGWRERCVRDVAGADRALFVARDAGRLVGHGRVRYFAPPSTSPAGTAHQGWYLGGLLVDPRKRRAGIGEALTRARMSWLAGRADQVWYFANAANPATLALHARFGFEEVTSDFSFPGLAFDGGVGVLCRVRLGPGPAAVQMVVVDQTHTSIAAQVLGIQRAAYRVEADLISFDAIPGLHDTVEGISKLDLTILGALDGTELVAILGYRRHGDVVDVDRPAVHPSRFRGGIASALLHEVRRREVGARRIDVATAGRNRPAIELYPKLGYRRLADKTGPGDLAIAQFEWTR